jgi:hypothetical protein
MDQILFGVIIKATYDLGKYALNRAILDRSIKDFAKIFDETIVDISKKYSIVASDLEAFFCSKEVDEHLKLHLDDMDIDFDYLGNILISSYIILNSELSAKEIVQEFFETLQVSLLGCPGLKERLIVKYFRVLKQNTQELIENTEWIMEKQDNFEKMLSQVSVSGKTLLREDYPNNLKFFKEVSKILSEDPLYCHNININDSKITYSLIPRSIDSQKLEPIRISFTIILEQRDGKIITLDEMINESEKNGKPIIIDANAIKEVSIYKGRKSLIPNDKNICRIEIRPIPYELPVKIFVPGCDIEYDIILRVVERNPKYLIVSNYFSDFPIKFKLQFDLEKGDNFKKSANFRINCDTNNMDVTQAFKFNKFFKEATSCGVVGLKDSKNGSIIFIAHMNDERINIASDAEYGLLRKLSFIQEITGKRILLPLEMTAGDAGSIENAYEYYKNRKMFSSFNGYRLTMKQNTHDAQQMLDNADKDGIFRNFSHLEKEASIKFCGHELPLGSIEVQYPPMKTERPIEELREELSRTANESIEIVMIPVEDRPLTIIPREWIGKEGDGKNI